MVSGTGTVVSPPNQAIGTANGATTTATGDITLNFVDTDIREILRAVLSDLLHVNYTIDSKIQANLTLRTGSPLRRSDLLPALQAVLRTSGLSLVQSGGIYRVVPSDEGARGGALPVVVANPQGAGTVTHYGVTLLPLRYASAAEMQRTLEPYLPKGSVLQIDPARNLLILSGSGADISTAVDMARSFDIDWLKGMSFAVVPLRTADPTDVTTQLQQIFGPDGAMPLPGVLRVAPLERMNAVLIVSPQRRYVDQARSWIDRLDRGEDENKPRIYQYRVQNSRAADVAKVLTDLLSSGSVKTVLPPTAPGTIPVQLGQTGPASALAGAAPGGGALGGSVSGGLMPGGSAVGATPTGGVLPGLASTLGGPASGAAQPNQPQSAPPVSVPAASGVPAEAESSASTTSLPPPPVRVVADEKNNTLLVYARPKDYRMVEEALEKLDVVPLQVLIEATIAEVTLNHNLQFGIQYFLKQNNNAAIFGNTTTPVVPPIPGTFPGFNYIFSTSNTNIVINALSAITDLHVISSPELLVLDHQAASLVVGNEVPIPISQTTYPATTGTGAPITSNNIQYIDTGVVLHVSPRVNANGLITLDISQEVSDVASTPAVNTPTGAPTIEQRRIQSTITVQDGQSIALGGLITDTKNITKNGIPLLSDIPVLGALFRSTDDSSVRTELLILLSPKVLHNPSEARAASDELRSRLHTLAPGSGLQ